MYEKILNISTEYFSRKGYFQTTIGEIASTLNINEATIYGYFKSKEEILLKIPFEKLNFFLKSLSDHLQGIKGAENKLRKLVWHQLNFFQTHREYITIFLLEIRSNPRFYQSPAYGLIKEYSNALLKIIDEGQEEGIFRMEVNKRLVRDMILGTIEHVTLPWVIFKKSLNLTEKSDELCELFLTAIKK